MQKFFFLRKPSAPPLKITYLFFNFLLRTKSLTLKLLVLGVTSKQDKLEQKLLCRNSLNRNIYFPKNSRRSKLKPNKISGLG